MFQSMDDEVAAGPEGDRIVWLCEFHIEIVKHAIAVVKAKKGVDAEVKVPSRFRDCATPDDIVKVVQDSVIGNKKAGMVTSDDMQRMYESILRTALAIIEGDPNG